MALLNFVTESEFFLKNWAIATVFGFESFPYIFWVEKINVMCTWRNFQKLEKIELTLSNSIFAAEFGFLIRVWRGYFVPEICTESRNCVPKISLVQNNFPFCEKSQCQNDPKNSQMIFLKKWKFVFDLLQGPKTNKLTNDNVEGNENLSSVCYRSMKSVRGKTLV